MRLIDADELKKNAYQSVNWNSQTGSFDLCVVDLIDIENAKTVDVVNHGRWEHTELIDGHMYGECSLCLKVRIIDNYCPNCGAKMEGDTDAEKET